MATDSRWSIRSGNYVVYLDDTGFEKIEICNNYAIMFAGNGGRIQEWKNWIRSNPTDNTNKPPEEGICVCIADMDTKEVIEKLKQTILPGGGYFAGSGEKFAAACWIKNNCAKKSVETAKSVDIFSGGEVKYYNFADGDNNLNLNHPVNVATIQMVDSAIHKRGLVMTINNTGLQSKSIVSAANDNLEIADIRSQIAAGDLSANAPSNGMYEEWTSDEKQRLDNAFAKIFKWKC